MASDDRLEQIERYLLGEMPEEERRDFEQAIARDEALAAEVDMQRAILEATTEKEVIRFRQTLAEIQAEKDKKSSRLSPRRLMSIAAALAVLAIAAYFLLRVPPPSSTSEELYAIYFEIPAADDILPPGLSPRGDSLQQQRGTSTDYPAWEESKALFRSGRYREALEKMRTVEVPEGMQRDDYYFQLGVLHLINGEAEQALENLERVQDSYPFAGDWYRAMALLKLGRAEEAKSALQGLAEGENPWREEAVELLERL